VASLHVDGIGAGEPVVLLHSHGLSGGQWRKLASELAERGLRVLAVDLTGHGASEPWPDRKPFSFATDVERVTELLHTMQPAHLVGHSYGGLIALHVARLAPMQVRTLALFDPVVFGVLDPDDDRDARAVLEALDLIREDQREHWLRTFVEFWSGTGAWSALRADTRDEFRRVWWVIREGVRTLVDDTTPLAAFANLDIPTLLMTGEHSPLPARRVIERLAQVMRRASREVIPGVGHLGPVTNARDVNPTIIAHLASDHADLRASRPPGARRLTE
jgi:pimeloyl-ACP methyl ester carboxylesterase